MLDVKRNTCTFYSKGFVNKRLVHKEGEFYSHKPLNSHLLFTKMHKEFPPFVLFKI